MLRKLVASAVLLIVGYVAGTFFGYRAAVTDYVENDAATIESMADDMYETESSDEVTTVPDEVGALLEEAKNEESTDGESESRGFQ